MINIKLKSCCDNCTNVKLHFSSLAYRTSKCDVTEYDIICKHAEVCYKFRDDDKPIVVHATSKYEGYL